MSYSQVLEVVIGLIFVYYVLGSVVSLITQWINEAFDTRGKSLETQLMRIVGEKQVGDFVKLPQLDALRPIRYKSWLGFLNASTEPKKLEKVPVSTLVDAFFDYSSLTATTTVNADGLKNAVNALPDSEGKAAVIKWINQGVTNLEDLRKRTTSYFSGVTDQAAATFKAQARSFVILISILVTLLLGTDSIQLAQTLWTNTSLRAITTVQAEMAVQQGNSNVNVDDLLKQLSDLNIVRIGWWQAQLPGAGTQPIDWIKFLVLKVIGLGLTAAAVSQGSSFWYDLLKKISTPASSSSSSTSSGGGSSSSSSSSG